VPSGSTVVIYADSLASGWANWSWDTSVNFGSTAKKKVGTKSIAATYTKASAGLYLHTDTALSTQGYTKIRFWINGAGGNQKLKFWVRNASGGSGSVSLPTLTNSWVQVEVSLSQLGNLTSLNDLVFQDTLGKAQPTFYVDQIELVK